MNKTIAACLLLTTLTACQHPGQNRYGYQDVGKTTHVKFGTVVTHRAVAIEGKNTGTGALAGVAGGALGGSYIGDGTGALGAALAGALIAGIAGHMAEQAIQNHDGVEFIVALEDGEVVTVVQNAEPELAAIRDGDPVMVQQSGEYQRVLPAKDLPAKAKKAKHPKVAG